MSSLEIHGPDTRRIFKVLKDKIQEEIEMVRYTFVEVWATNAFDVKRV